MSSKTDMSVMKIEEEVRNRPKSFMFSRLADSYRKSGNVQQAISVCLEGLASHPDYITGRIILGRCYLEQESFNEAIKEFTKVCKIDRRNQITIKMLADIFSKQGMEAKAGDLYHLLLKMDPDNASLIHLAKVFKGNNKESLFEILGVEDEIKPVSAARADVKPMQVKTEIEEAQELLGETGAATVSEQALLSELGDGTDISLQEAAEIIDESSLDEMLSTESGIVDAGDLVTADQPEPEAAKEPVAEPKTVPEVESIVEKEPEKTRDAPTVSIEPPKQADISLEEDELPEGADITARMSSMFGEETEDTGEGTIEIAVPDVGVAAVERVKESAAREEKTIEKEAPQEPVDDVASAISSRMEDMFGEDEIAEVSAPTEMLELEPVEEILSEGDGDTAATVIIDKAELERISGLDAEAEGTVEEEIPAGEGSGLDVLGISEEDAPLLDDMDDTEPETAMPAQEIHHENKKTEIIEEPLAIENVLESVDLEDPERAASDFQKSDELMDSMLTEATSVFDKETIRKLTEKESRTPAEAGPSKVVGAARDESVSGEDVISRLDEMFPSDTKKGRVPKPKPQAEPIKKSAGGEEGIPAEERVHGEDVVSRIDEMFVTADAIPDEEIKEDETINDFYTETGDLALLDETETILEEAKQISETDDDILAGQFSDEKKPPVDEAVVSGISLDAIPDEELETGKETGDFYDVSGDKVIEDAAALLDEIPEETEKAVEDDLLSGEDVVATIDKMFAGDGLENGLLLDAIPEEEGVEEKAPGGGFYNVAGEETKGETPDDGTDTAAGEEAAEETVIVDDETYFYKSGPLQEQQPGTDTVGEESDHPVKAESIPDHVLTPTLADIYFQQDQPYLAVQIYKRLLERDPDNEKIVRRIAEIEQVIREKEAMIEVADSEKMEERLKKAGKVRLKTRDRRHEAKGRPLTGIKIKKSVKKRIKKTRQELESGDEG